MKKVLVFAIILVFVLGNDFPKVTLHIYEFSPLATDLDILFINDLHESNFIVNEKNHELYVIDLDSCRIKYTQPTPSKYLTPKTLINATQGKYQLADEDCPTYGYVIADENSDLFCYTMMFLCYI